MSHIHIPVKTIALMDQCIRVDQGAKYRGWLRKVLPHIGDAYRDEEEDFRSHLGASVLGQECERAIYYGWRWTTKTKFSGQMLRLFNRGHLEEGRIIALFLAMGLQVYQQDENGKQFRISFANGHGGGSGDGVVLGIPDLEPGVAALGEFKTHKASSFKDLAGDDWRDYVNACINPKHGQVAFSGKGVRESKPEHYAQMQTYMERMRLVVTLYIAVNKDTDDIYAELVPLNSTVANSFIARGERLVGLTTPPKKLNQSPGFWKCKFCDHRGTCHLGVAPERNCRTCAFSSAVEDGEGKWICRLREMTLPKEVQLIGCEQYVEMPGLR